jgi:hypothetical protein
MTHWFIVLGSTVGLLTGLYTLFDRLWRERPLVSLGKAEDKDSLALRVKNIGLHDVVIDAHSVLPGGIYSLSASSDLHDVLDAAAGVSFVRLLAPGMDTELRVVPLYKDGRRLDENKHTVLFLVFWRRTRSMWLPQPPLGICIRTDKLRLLEEARA